MTLSACTVIPGSHLSAPPSAWFYDEPDLNYAVKTDIEFVPITAHVIESQMVNRPEAAQPPTNLMNDIADYEYRIGYGDALNITVYEHPELTIPAGSFRGAEEGGNAVYPDGTFFFPYAGKVEAVGKTTDEIRQVLVERLSRVIEQPQVDVKVAGFNSQKVFVSGEVKQPAVLPIKTTPLTLVDAINQVGGLTPDADWRNATLTRDGTTETIDLRAVYEHGNWQRNILLKHSDVVHVPRNDSQKIYVMGEVNRPQTILIGRDTVTLAGALSQASGIDENQADPRGIFVLRNAERRTAGDGSVVYGATVYQLNANRATGFMLADSFELKPRDVVYVTAAPVARWNRLINQLVPSLVAADRAQDVENN